MEINTDVFSAVTAEAVMLRQHAERAAPARHRRPRRQRQPGEHPGPERGLDRWWRAGYARAMQEVLIVMGESAEYAEALADGGAGTLVTAGDQADRLRATVLSAVLAVAEAAVELHHADTMPALWADGQ